MFMVLDHLLPHQTIGLALSCRRLLELTDRYFNCQLPPSERANQGVTLRWASKFRALPLDQQSAVETTVGVLPLLEIFAPIDHDTERLYLSMARAVSSMKKREFQTALHFIKEAEEVALGTGLEVEVRTFKSHCQLKRATSNVKRFAHKGIYGETLFWIKQANTAASMAGRPLPDFTGVLRAIQENSSRRLVNR
jgi:hypothetical protein